MSRRGSIAYYRLQLFKESSSQQMGCHIPITSHYNDNATSRIQSINYIFPVSLPVLFQIFNELFELNLYPQCYLHGRVLFTNFERNPNWQRGNFNGVRRRCCMKKTRGKKSRETVPLRFITLPS